jgi:hypothetical protein
MNIAGLCKARNDALIGAMGTGINVRYSRKAAIGLTQGE